MPNVRLVIEFDGAGFHGWQSQPGLRTIEDELKRVLTMVLRQKVQTVYASGRTDAGVHARAQVVNFHVPEAPDLKVLRQGVSGVLKGELAVLEANLVADDFHARESALAKQYSYNILHRDAPSVLDHGKVWHVSAPLNFDRMRKEALQFVGQHDFTSFRASGCSAKSAIKEILESEIIVDLPIIKYRVVGRGFLKQMVRNIVGTLVEIGKGRLEEPVAAILAARDRARAGSTAPAHGLFLDWVGYG